MKESWQSNQYLWSAVTFDSAHSISSEKASASTTTTRVYLLKFQFVPLENVFINND